MKIVLASGSPRRKEILEQVGVEFQVIPAKGDEVITKTVPEDIVKELSYHKAEEIASGLMNGSMKVRVSDSVWKSVTATDEDEWLIIGSDTIVSYQRQVLGKPKDEVDAVRMLKKLEGNKHQVYTGVTCFLLRSGRVEHFSFAEKTEVYVESMTDQEILNYVATKEPMDKAGAYGVQGKFAAYVQKLDGDFYNVMGLPIARLVKECKRHQISLIG